MDTSTISLDLRSLRQQSGIKQKYLAEAVGMTVHELAKLERGFAYPDDDLRLRILDVLNGFVPISENGPLNLGPIECGEGYVTAKPKKNDMISRRQSVTANKKYVFDLFCGVGGFSTGFEQTGVFEVVAGVDLLGDRLKTFSSNHSRANAYGQDIRTLETAMLDEDNPRPFVVLGGPPCQGFSSIRPFRNVEWSDPRNNLAEEFCRIVADLRPEWIVFENVVGLVTHDKGRAVQVIREAFEALGYRTDAKVLNTAFYGIPQRRERLIIVGSLRNKKFKWPTPTTQADVRSMVGNSSPVETGGRTFCH
jgi:DNA (cytosine-5)-methyltransferase 1